MILVLQCGKKWHVKLISYMLHVGRSYQRLAVWGSVHFTGPLVKFYSSTPISGLFPDLFSQEHLFNLLRLLPWAITKIKERSNAGSAVESHPTSSGTKAIWKLTIIQQRSVT